MIYDYENASVPSNMKTEVAIQLITHALENIGFNSPFKFFVYLGSPLDDIYISYGL